MRNLLLLPLLCLLAAMTAPLSTGQTPDLYDEDTVRDFRLTFSQANWWNLLYQNMANEIYLEADLEVDGIIYPQVGVRFKGNSSASVWPNEKMPFKIHMEEFVAGQELYGYDNINLHNSFMDPTFTREVVTYRILRDYMPAPRSNYVRLWLNGAYWGIYVNTQQVSGEFLDEWFEDSSGTRYKCDPTDSAPPGSTYNSTLVWLGSNPSSYFDYYELKSDPDGTEWYDLIDVIDVLNNRPVTVHWTELSPLLFMDRCLWYLSACNLFCNLDSYIGSGHNYYMYRDPHEGRFNPIPWDTNEAFGNYAMISGAPPLTPTQLQQLSPLLNYGSADHPLITRLLNPSAGIRGRQVYLAHLRDMLLESWNWTNIGGLVQQYQDLIEPDVINDTKKLYSLNYFYLNVTQNVNIGNRTSCGLRPFVMNRETYLKNQSIISATYPDISGTTLSPASPDPDDDVLVLSTVTVSGAAMGGVSVYYRTGAGQLFQELPMYDDGQHGDGSANDGVYGEWIPAQPGGSSVEYFILAHTSNDTVALDPIFGESNPSSYYVNPGSASNGVFINEFLAKNDTGLQDEMGEYEDWVELYNETASLIDLSGTYLTDDLADLTKWRIPAGTTLSPGGTLLIWADDDPGDGPLHAEFKLSADGEEIALVDTDGSTLLDSIVFGEQEPDISTGRLFDGDDLWVTFLAPSPEALNAPGTTGYRTYSALDSTVHTIGLEGIDDPLINGTTTLQVRNGPGPGTILMPVSLSAGYQPISAKTDTRLLLAPPLVLVLTLSTNAAGELDLPISLPLDQSLVGVTFYFQILAQVSGYIEGSNGLEMIIGQ